ncbi:MAG: hypothetical protein WCE21_02535 [Candidatus Babeliales bacterium]
MNSSHNILYTYYRAIFFCTLLFVLPQADASDSARYESFSEQRIVGMTVPSLTELCVSAVGRYMSSGRTVQKLLGDRHDKNISFTEQVVRSLPHELRTQLLVPRLQITECPLMKNMKRMVDTLYITRDTVWSKKNGYFPPEDDIVIHKDSSEWCRLSEVSVKHIVLSPNKKYVAVATFDEDIQIVDIASGKLSLSINSAPVSSDTSMHFSDSHYLFCVNKQDELMKYNLQSGMGEKIATQVSDICARLNHSQSLLIIDAFNSSDIIARIVDENGLEQKKVALNRAQQFAYFRACDAFLHHDKEFLVINAGFENKIYPSAQGAIAEIWDLSLPHPEIIARLNHALYKGQLRTIRYMPDERCIATGTEAEDHTIYLWSVDSIYSPKMLVRIKLLDNSPICHIWCNSKALYLADGSGTVRKVEGIEWALAVARYKEWKNMWHNWQEAIEQV